MAEVKVIDPEFAIFGPPGLDPGISMDQPPTYGAMAGDFVGSMV